MVRGCGHPVRLGREVAGLNASEVLTRYRSLRPFNLEELITDPQLFGLTTATPLQRAVARIIDGRPLGELRDHPDVLWGIGDVSVVEGHRPFEVYYVASTRSAKSLFSVATGFYHAVTADLSFIRDMGERGTVSILSLNKRTAKPTLLHLRSIEHKPELAKYIVGEPKSDSVTIQNRTNRLVDLDVVAGAKAGSNLVGRWQVCCIFDEAPRMNGSEDGVINLEDQRDAVYSRIVPGGQILYPGSPYKPHGPVYDIVHKHWRRPTRDLVVIRGQGPMLNPHWWTKARCENVKRNQPSNYVTDCLAEFASPEETIFKEESLGPCTRENPAELPYSPRCAYYAAIDPATTTNAFTLVVVTKESGKRKVVLARQWKPEKGQTLKLRETIEDIAEVCMLYGISRVETDRHLAPAILEFGKEMGLAFFAANMTQKQATENYLSLAMRIDAGDVELPPDRLLLLDLKRVKRVPTIGGGVRIVLPLTADGRHCDYAPALMLAMSALLKDAKEAVPQAGTHARAEYDAAKVKAERFAMVKREAENAQKPWKRLPFQNPWSR